MVVSLEAIFLSIFVLMSQNREAGVAELREELMLQVNLRMEQEVTKTLQLVAGLYARMGHQMSEEAELLEMLQPLDADEIERQLSEQIRNPSGRSSRGWKRLGRRGPAPTATATSGAAETMAAAVDADPRASGAAPPELMVQIEDPQDA